MIKTVKRVMPIVVFISLAAGAAGLWMQSFQPEILGAGMASAVIIGLLLYVVINWDDALEDKKRETRQLADLVNRATDAIVICDSNGAILYANASAMQAYALEPPEQNKQTLQGIGLLQEQMHDALQEVLAGGAWNGELAFEDRDAKKHVQLVGLFRLEEFRGCMPAIVSIGRDLTRRRELEQQLRHSQKLAAVGELAAGVAHEINNPMASIQSQIGLARDLMTLHGKVPDDSAEILACLDDAGRQIDRCSRIVESLLRFSRPAAPQLACVDVGQAIENAIQLTRALVKMKNVKVIYDSKSKLPPIHSDVDSISQILVNLLVNAADALQHSGEVWIELAQPSAEQFAIRVIDYGCGVEPKNLERIFDPFFTTKAPDQGTGLGLSISYGMARSLGGDLELRPLAEGGTCATLSLPIGAAVSEST